MRTSINANCCQNPYIGQRNEWGYNPTDESTGGMHARHLREATTERNVENGSLQAPYHCPRPALRTSNRDPGAKRGYGSEPARTSGQVGRCGRLSSPSLLHRYGESYCRYRWRGFFFQLGTCPTRSREIYSGVFVLPLRNRLERIRSERLLLPQG